MFLSDELIITIMYIVFKYKKEVLRIEKRNKEVEGLSDVYSQLVEFLGFDNTKKIYENLKGQQITFPKRLYKVEYVIDEVKLRYNGKNLKDLAREFDYTERYLRQLIKDNDHLDTS